MPMFFARRAIAVQVLVMSAVALAAARVGAQGSTKAPVEAKERERCDGCCSVDIAGDVVLGAPVVHLLLMLDRSGSMQLNNRWAELRNLVEEIKNKIPPDVELSVMAFPAPGATCSPYQDFPVVPYADAAPLLEGRGSTAPTARCQSDSHTCRETPLARAIFEAGQWAASKSERSVVVLLTDGTNTVDLQSHVLKQPDKAEDSRFDCSDLGVTTGSACAPCTGGITDDPVAMLKLTCRMIRCFEERVGSKASLHVLPLPKNTNASHLDSIARWASEQKDRQNLRSVNVHRAVPDLASHVSDVVKAERCRIPLSAGWLRFKDDLTLTHPTAGSLRFQVDPGSSVLQIDGDDHNNLGKTSCDKFIDAGGGATLSVKNHEEKRCRWTYVPPTWSLGTTPSSGTRKHRLDFHDPHDPSRDIHVTWEEERHTIVSRAPIPGTDCQRIGICRDVDDNHLCEPDKDAFVQFLVTCDPGLKLDVHDPPPAATGIGGIEATEISPPGDRSAVRLRTGMAQVGGDGGGFGLTVGIRPYRALRAAHSGSQGIYHGWYKGEPGGVIRYLDGLVDTLEVSSGIATARRFPLTGPGARHVGSTVNTLAVSFDFFELARAEGGSWSWYPGSGASAVSACFLETSKPVEERTSECLPKGSNLVLGTNFLLDWQRVPLANLGGSTVSAADPRHFAWRLLGSFRVPPDSASGADRFAVTGQLGQDIYLHGFIDKYLKGVRPPEWQKSFDMALQVAAAWRPVRVWLELAGHTNVPDLRGAGALGLDLFWLYGTTISPAARLQAAPGSGRAEVTFFVNVGGSATNSSERIPAKPSALTAAGK